jgi:hypothetical protein
MTQPRTLRPFERRVVRLVHEGVAEAEIARRFRRSPETIHRVITLTGLPRSEVVQPQERNVLRPLERRVLRWRDSGAGYEEISPRFRRSPAFVQQVEDLARYKLRRA